MKESTEIVVFGSDHRRHGFNRPLLVLLLVLLALGTLMSSSDARPVKEVSVVGGTEKGYFAVEGKSHSLSLEKEIVDSVAKASDQVQTSGRNGGRKGRRKRSRDGRNYGKKLVSMGKGGVGKGNWKDNYYMSFSADYRSPKPHPPRNN